MGTPASRLHATCCSSSATLLCTAPGSAEAGWRSTQPAVIRARLESGRAVVGLVGGKEQMRPSRATALSLPTICTMPVAASVIPAGFTSALPSTLPPEPGALPPEPGALLRPSACKHLRLKRLSRLRPSRVLRLGRGAVPGPRAGRVGSPAPPAAVLLRAPAPASLLSLPATAAAAAPGT